MVTINEPPLLECTYDPLTLLCEGQDIPLNVTPSGGTPPYSYVWTSSNAGVTFINADNTSQNPTAVGAKIGDTFSVEITDANGCKTTCGYPANLMNCMPDCETAFAVATDEGAVDESISRCFRQDGFSRWGWTNEISEWGTYTFDLYQGAGKCDLTKGTYVGTLTLIYASDNTVNVTYETIGGYTFSEAHFYAGCPMYPTKKNGTIGDPEDWTVAPGQFPFNAGDVYPTDKVVVPEFTAEGTFYFIAHAVVCGVDIPNPPVMFIPGYPNDGDTLVKSVETNSLAECKVNTDDFRIADFTAYPVPFKGEVNVKYTFDYDTKVTIQVYDVKGALIKSYVDNNYVKGSVERAILDLSKADDQMYFVRLTTDKGTMVKKIVSDGLNKQ